jgi:hypothetical protein
MNVSRTTRLVVTLVAATVMVTAFAGAAHAGIRPAGMSKAEYRALMLRSEALNRKYHLGSYSVAARASEPVTSPGGFAWSAFGIGATAMLGLILLTSGVIAGGRYGRRVPRTRISA